METAATNRIIQKSSELQAYIVGGQPGAGKSALVDKIKGDRDDIIFINGDHIRTYYPGAKKISMEDYPTVTQPFVNMCVERLIDELSDEKYNLIIEGTLRDKNIPLKTASLLKEKGYYVELDVLAVNKELSWQSTLDRAEWLRQQGAIPRTVAKEKHDAIVTMLPITVGELNKSELFDEVIIMTRFDEVLYRRSDGNPQKDPEKLLREELENGNLKEISKFEEEMR